MTTSHRPTWKAAVGGEEQGGMRHYVPSKMQSVKDIAGFTKMKYRKEGQNSLEELKAKDLKSVLEEKERKHFLKASKEEFIAEKEEDLKLLESGVEAGLSGPKGSLLVPKPIDVDDEDEDASDDSDSDDDDDDEAELLAELARIKKEREEEAAHKAAEEAAIQEKEERQEMMRGNPLLQDKLAGDANGGAGGTDKSFALKRRWDDDVVFKNQARNEPKQQRRFINDTLRSDFHKRFLERYIK